MKELYINRELSWLKFNKRGADFLNSEKSKRTGKRKKPCLRKPYGGTGIFWRKNRYDNSRHLLPCSWNKR